MVHTVFPIRRDIAILLAKTLYMYEKPYLLRVSWTKIDIVFPATTKKGIHQAKAIDAVIIFPVTYTLCRSGKETAKNRSRLMHTICKTAVSTPHTDTRLHMIHITIHMCWGIFNKLVYFSRNERSPGIQAESADSKSSMDRESRNFSKGVIFLILRSTDISLMFRNMTVWVTLAARISFHRGVSPNGVHAEASILGQVEVVEQILACYSKSALWSFATSGFFVYMA